MREHRFVVVLTAALAIALVLPVSACAQAQQEHPEHPEEGEEAAAANPGITMDALAQAIEAHITEEAGEDGAIEVHDPVTGETLQLTLDQVHRERLAKVGPETYFACADFTSADGVAYDVDFFMKGASADSLVFEDLSIHKVAGEPRYTWHEEDGVWKKKGTGEEAEEHPEGEEHPDEEGEEHPDEEGEEHPDEGGEEHPEGQEEPPDGR